MKRTPSHVNVSLNKLTVNSVESNSGIFIGATNLCYGWSSHSKSNNGFGSFSDSTVTKSFCVIYDNDSIDTPIVDSKKFLMIKPKEEPKTDIHFTDINVNGMETNAAISLGDVDQAGWSSHSKNNVGEGSSTGVNTSINNQIKIVDNDLIDVPITHQNDFRNYNQKGDGNE